MEILTAGAKKHTEVYEFITFYLCSSPPPSTGNVKRASIVLALFLVSRCNVFGVGGGLGGREMGGLRRVERAGWCGRAELQALLKISHIPGF